MPNVFLTTFFFWLVCAESLVTSVIDLSGNLSKSTSGPFSNIAAQRMITWRGSCTTRYENPAATPLLMTPFSRRLNSSEILWFSQTIKARWLEKKKEEMKGKGNLWNVYDALFITGRSVHHGDEENLPKTESKRSMCQGQRAVYFPDVRLLPLHRGRFWVVSSLLCSYSVHFIKSNAQHFINLQRHSLWSKTEAQQAECYKTYLL